MDRCATILGLFILVMLIGGCAQPPSYKTVSPSEAHQKLVQILKEENSLEIVTKEFENTLWIYLPLEEHFLTMKATPQGPQSSDQPAVKPSVKFLDGWFKDGGFHLKYDIGPAKSYAQDPGYTSNIAEEYQTNQRYLLTAISRAYADVTETAPDFFVIVMADTVNGLEYEVLLYLGDVKRASTDHSFHGEYQKRVISKQPYGRAGIIGDQEGKHLDYRDIAWTEFLARQMVFRINYRYLHSAFLPSEDARAELLTAAADTVGAYNFTEFTSLRLHDLNDDSVEEIPQEELSGYGEEPSGGRLIHIRFQ